jgi:predicted transcriptional regulator
MSKATQQALAQLAKKKKVSFSWVLRDAAERYVEANKGHPDASEKNA